ncbi:hypothetical protein GOP47_0014894 [Adiantum capillus-veneris]|uniref:Uncharacterized protein n=1 Tax=Adiantum capillus-veneris TaxID=13818 RepID=A0A9D4UME6_ADICA|nr:hypothetical protein GOP47_0014894 [Adiantum capillus-veneris]
MKSMTLAHSSQQSSVFSFITIGNHDPDFSPASFVRPCLNQVDTQKFNLISDRLLLCLLLRLLLRSRCGKTKSRLNSCKLVCILSGCCCSCRWLLMESLL